MDNSQPGHGRSRDKADPQGTNQFFKEVIAEEDAIDKEADEIRKRITALKKEIALLEKNDVFYYRRRKYCKFSDGYNCEFSGSCNHKKPKEEYCGIVFGSARCLAEKHARVVMK